jgi:hypothetical protein
MNIPALIRRLFESKREREKRLQKEAQGHRRAEKDAIRAAKQAAKAAKLARKEANRQGTERHSDVPAANATRKLQKIYESRSFNDLEMPFVCRVCKQSFGRFRISCLGVFGETKIGCYCHDCGVMICKTCQMLELGAYLDREKISHFDFPGAILSASDAKWHLETCCLLCATMMAKITSERRL